VTGTWRTWPKSYRSAGNKTGSNSFILRVHEVLITDKSHEIVRDLVEILYAQNRVFDAAWFTAAIALKARIECNDDKPLFRERFAVHVARGLLFATSNWVGADNRWILFLLIEIWRKVDIGGNVLIPVIDFHVLDVLRRHVFTSRLAPPLNYPQL